MIDLDNFDRKLLGLLQAEFPVTGEPYADLGLKLGIDGGEVIRRIHDLKARRIVRQISPVLDARKLGYESTLGAMKIAPERLAAAAQVIREHPGVSHGYERDHDFNVWITLSVPRGVDIEHELERLAAAAGAGAAFALPALKMFKLRAIFGADGEVPEAPAGNGTGLPQKVGLSRADRLVVNELQQDLPLAPSPFEPVASRVNMSVDDFLGQCRSLLQRGVIRRFGAAVNHRNAGFKANAMVCWAAANGTAEALGRRLASLKEVSHCYERKTNPLWRHNLFAMIHGHTPADCHKIIGEVSGETGLSDHVALFSTREIKKVRVKYLV